jgi:hypothetical protein
MFSSLTKAPDVFGPPFKHGTLQRHWLVRKYVNQTNPPPSHPLPETAMPEKKPLPSLHSPRDSAN